MTDKTKKIASAVAVQVTAEELKDRIMNSLIDGVERTYYDEDGEEIAAGLGGLLTTVADSVVKEVKGRFEDQIEKEVKRAIEEAVKAQIASGFFTVDRYGGRTEPKSLNQIIQEQLSAKSSRGYQMPERTMAMHVIADAVENALKGELAAELKQLKEAFASQVKAKLSAAAGEAISRAMGIF